MPRRAPVKSGTEVTAPTPVSVRKPTVSPASDETPRPSVLMIGSEALPFSKTGGLADVLGALPQALALDGKMIRNHIGLLTLAQHDDGAPQAIAVYDQKEGTERCEQTAAAQLLESLPALDNKIITADALHCQKEHARAIVEKGGDYLLQIKGNQPTLLKRAEGLNAIESTPFLNSPNADMAGCRPGEYMPSPSNP